MKRLATVGALLCGMMALLGWSALHFLKPAQPLDLAYRDISVSEQIVEMVRRRRMAVALNETEINHLLKKQLAARSDVTENFKLIGADFHYRSAQLSADIHLKYKGKVDIGANLLFELKWEHPYVVASHVRTRVRSVHLPPEWLKLEPIRIHLSERLPKAIAIQDVQFLERELLIVPTLVLPD